MREVNFPRSWPISPAERKRERARRVSEKTFTAPAAANCMAVYRPGHERLRVSGVRRETAISKSEADPMRGGSFLMI